MSRVTDKYYSGLQAFEDAVDSREYALAAQTLKLTLKVTGDAMQSLRSRGAPLPPSIPVFESRAIFIAALYKDREVDELYEDFATSEPLSGRVDYQNLLETRAVIFRIAESLQGHGSRNRAELRSDVDPRDGRNFARVLDWLLKGGLIHERDGRYYPGSLASDAEPVPEESFRRLAELPTFAVPDLSRVPNMQNFTLPAPPWLKRWTPPPASAITGGATPVLTKDEVLTPEGTLPMDRTPLELRVEGKPRIAVLARYTWLITTKRLVGPSKTSRSVAQIRDMTGSVARTIDVPGSARTVFSSPDRSWISILTPQKIVYVYREDGELLDVINLSDNNDLRELANLMQEPQENVYWLRAFDYDPTTQRVLYSYGDYAVVASRAGEVIHALRAPGVPEHSEDWPEQRAIGLVAETLRRLNLPPETSLRQAAAWLHSAGTVKVKRILSVQERLADVRSSSARQRKALAPPRSQKVQLARFVGPLVADPIQYARFMNGGIEISTDSGLNLAYDENGNVTRGWQTPGPAQVLTARTENGTEVAKARFNLVRIDHHVVNLAGTGNDILVSRLGEHPDWWMIGGPDWLAYWTDNLLCVRYAADWQKVHAYRLPKPLTALHPEGIGIRVHVGIRNFLVCAPIDDPKVVQ